MIDVETDTVLGGGETVAVPWEAVWRLLSPGRRDLAGRVSLSLAGSFAGLVPALALGYVINATVAGARTSALLWVGAIGVTVIVEGVAYVFSDGLYARVASRLYRDLRSSMFAGVLRRDLHANERAALASRFVSDTELMEQLTVAALDQGAVSVFDLLAALGALAVIDSWLIAVVAGAVGLALAVLSVLRRPAAAASDERQGALEAMSDALVTPGSSAESTWQRFSLATEAVAAAELRLGWIGAVNRQGSQAMTGVGQVAVILAAALQRGLGAGTLLSVYLLAGRALGATETLFDAYFEIELSRGALGRCFALADLTTEPLRMGSTR